MKIIGLTLSILLFLNPLAALATEKSTPKQKTSYKAIVGDVSKVTSALLKISAGAGFLFAGTTALCFALAATLSQDHGFRSIDTNIELNFVRNTGKVEQEKYSFNAWPLICASLAVFGTCNYGLAFLSLNSAKNDLQAINEEPVN